MKKRIVKCDCCGCHFFASLEFHKLCLRCSEYVRNYNCKKCGFFLWKKEEQLCFAEKTISVLENEVDRLEKLVIHLGGKLRELGEYK